MHRIQGLTFAGGDVRASGLFGQLEERHREASPRLARTMSARPAIKDPGDGSLALAWSGDRGSMGGWRLYQSEAGAATVSDEINAMLPKAGKIKLGALLQRIDDGETLPGDVRPLTGEIDEARLTWQGQQFRLYFARISDGGRAVLLGLRAINKKSPKASLKDIRLSETRLRDWKARPPSA